MEIRKRLTYANVMSTIAAFAALATGGAYAAEKIATNDLKPNAVTSPKIRNGGVQTDDLKGRAVTDGKLAADSVTGSKIRSGSIGGDAIRSGSISCLQLDPALATTIKGCNPNAP